MKTKMLSGSTMLYGAALAAALAAAATMSSPASAAVVFNLSNVYLVDGGQLTGTLTTSDDLSTLVGFSITSTSNNSFFGNFIGQSYTLGNAAYAFWNPAQGLSSLSLTPLANLNLFFTSPLTATGATLAFASSESQFVQGGGVRWAVSGELIAGQPGIVPEPAVWALMVTGFGLVGLGIRRRAGTFGHSTYA